uniref:Uncharacterized protein n=1 Tax=Oryza rufipogon TaxID=4529 RepID=A0A0E0Q8D5_ORYRU
MDDGSARGGFAAPVSGGLPSCFRPWSRARKHTSIHPSVSSQHLPPSDLIGQVLFASHPSSCLSQSTTDGGLAWSCGFRGGRTGVSPPAVAPTMEQNITPKHLGNWNYLES